MEMKLIFFIVVLAMAALLTENVLAQVIEVSNCADLTQSGATYVLTKDIKTFGEDCIIITAPSITLDCQKNKIEGNREGSGIDLDSYGVIVKNCKIDNFYFGITTRGYTSSIVDNEIYNCVEGISGGFMGPSSKDNSIERNKIRDCGSCISLGYIKNSVVSNNLLEDCYMFGIDLQGETFNNIFESNSIQFSDTGVFFYGDDYHKYKNNFFKANKICSNGVDFDLSDITSDTLWENNVGMNNICDNPGEWNDQGAIGCSQPCLETEIEIDGCAKLGKSGATYTLTKDITASKSTGFACFEFLASDITLDCNGYSVRGPGTGVEIEGIANNIGGTIKNCRITNFERGVSLWSQPFTILDSTIEKNKIGVWLSEVTLDLISSKVCDNQQDFNKYNSEVIAEQATCDLYECTYSCKGIAPGKIKACGVLDQPGATYILTKNITRKAGEDCLRIIADEITLDCQGHTISGSGTQTQWAGVILGKIYYGEGVKRCHIKNCVIKNFNSGIGLYNSFNNSIENLNVEDTLTGIFLSVSSQNLIKNVTVSKSGTGIFLASSSNINKLVNNDIGKNKIGIEIEDSNNNYFENNKICENLNSDVDIGEMFGNSTGNSGNNNSCDIVRGSEKITEASFRFVINKSLFECYSCFGIIPGEIKMCGILDRPGDYFLTRDITANISAGARQECLTIKADNITLNCQGHTIRSLTKEGVGISLGERFFEKGANYCVVRNCTIETFDIGINVESSNFNLLEKNILNLNSYGIDMHHSNNNVIGGNIIINGSYGVFLDNSSRNEISDNNITYNDGNGIRIEETSNYNELKSNRICNNTYDILAAGGLGNIGFNNTCAFARDWNDKEKTGCTYGCKTCRELGGTICPADQKCRGTMMKASDTSNCCHGGCVYKTFWARIAGFFRSLFGR